jgi:hypothetical protein
MDTATIIAKCQYFRQLGLWPRQEELNFEGWLSNFLPSEKEFAITLLGQFVFYPITLTGQLFQATFHNLSQSLCKDETNFRAAQMKWNNFLSEVIITRVTGETPHDSDSGFQYVRMARDRIGIPEAQIMKPEDALDTVIQFPHRPLVFVDDFVGTGKQFNNTWKRLSTIASREGKTSFAEFHSKHPHSNVTYCVPVSTSLGIGNIHKVAPNVRIESAHILTKTNSAISAESNLWPPHLKAGAKDFITQASIRAGIPENECSGLFDLGLTIAFEHGIPDASLPLFYADTNGWKPLKRKLAI